MITPFMVSLKFISVLIDNWGKSLLQQTLSLQNFSVYDIETVNYILSTDNKL
jgi:hypothetical protein